MIRASVLSFLAASFILTGCGGSTRFSVPSDLRPESLILAGEYNIPPLGRFPAVVGLPFGGLSGLAPLGDGRYLAVCDERDGARVYRLRISGEGRNFRVEPEDVIGLQVSGDAPSALDTEAIVATPDNTMIIASEGIGNSEPRIPPSLLEYGMDGQFIRSIRLPARFTPNATGPLTAGARDNAALESLTMTPGGGRMFTAFETAVVQDGEPAGIGRGTVARIVEYVRDEGTYSPRREFAYMVEPVAPAPFVPAITVTGLVELLALSSDDLLAMERTYMAERRGDAAGGRALNRIRVYRVWLDGATDVSQIDSLNGVTYTPARKTLVLDLSDVKGLSPDLATLDNFEGMAAGPALADGARSLLLVSDDNFHQTQRTSFLLFRIGAPNQRVH